MIWIEVTKRFNNNVMFPMDIYTIDIYRHEKQQEGIYEEVLRSPQGKEDGIPKEVL